jgi:hypothetical protein
MRFTLRKLFLITALAAIASAALISPNGLWAASILSFTIVLFVAMALRAIGLHGRQRVFAIAFAAVGFGYLFVERSKLIDSYTGLITNYPLALMADAFHLAGAAPYPQTLSRSGSNVLLTMILNEGTPATRFFLIGHCVWSWLIGLLGGSFAGHVYAKRKQLDRL